MTSTAHADIVADLKAELKAVTDRNMELEERVNELSPTVDIRAMLFRTTKDVEDYFGPKKIDEMVKTRIAAERKAQSRQGFERKDYTPEDVAEIKAALLDSIVDDRVQSTPPDDGWITRTLKMVFEGSLRQVIYEGQVNNTAGSLADGLLVYERKGFKRTEPMLCPAQDCWEEAAVATSGKNKGVALYVGYCSEDHYRRTEKGAPPVPGA